MDGSDKDTVKEKALSAWRTLMLHNQGELARINRAATAKAWGLEPVQFATPYTQQTITNNSSGSAVAPLLIGTLMGTGILGAGIGLASWLMGPGPASIAPGPVKEAVNQVWDSTVEMTVDPPKE